jgi:predicted dehydrogenase
MKPVKGKVRVGVLGLGHRGQSQLKMLLAMEEVEIVCLCDLLSFRIDEGNVIVKEAYGRTVPGYTDYKELISAGGLDAVMIFTSWQTHIRIATHAMRAGIYSAMEVSGATSLNECWHLVQTFEETGVPCMLLENVCFGERFLTLLRMVKEGLFGELIYASGAYQHDLRDEIGLGREIKHYRFDHFLNRNADLYPTHDVGPLAKIMNINRGNRFLSLVSMATKARGLEKWYKESRRAWNPWVVKELEANHKGPLPETISDYDMIGRHITCGDVVTTMIKCAGGEVIRLIHDCTLARPRLSDQRIQGTNGIYMADAKSIYFEGKSPEEDKWEASDPYFEKYEHPLWKAASKDRDKGGHGGTDFLCMGAFIDAVKNGAEPPIDAYDAAAWMAITTLSEDSIAMGGHPVAFPDFTNGAWLNRAPIAPGRYALDNVYWEFFK